MNRNMRGIVIFAVAYFILFMALEWYINRISSPKSAFYASPAFAAAVIVYVAVVAAVLLMYRNRRARARQ